MRLFRKQCIFYYIINEKNKRIMKELVEKVACWLTSQKDANARD